MYTKITQSVGLKYIKVNTYYVLLCFKRFKIVFTFSLVLFFCNVFTSMVCSAGSLSMVYMGFSAIWVVNGGWFLLQEILSGWSSSPSPCCCGCCCGPDETVSGHVHRYWDSSFFDWTCGPSQTAAMQRTCYLLHRFAHRVDQSEAAYGARLPVRVHGNRCGCS